MACPYFLPSIRIEPGAWVLPPRMPLGDAFAGSCHARRDEILEPTESQIRELCNCGYARGRCDRFPPEGGGDAVRFSICSDRNGRVGLVYIIEKGHAPMESGGLEYVVDEAVFAVAVENELLLEQAKAFLTSYLRRRAAPV